MDQCEILMKFLQKISSGYATSLRGYSFFYKLTLAQQMRSMIIKNVPGSEYRVGTLLNI